MIKESFRKYLEEAIGGGNALVAFSAFQQPASVAVRLNPFKKPCGLEGVQVPWNAYGYMLESRPLFTLDPHFHAGAYYVQDSSSMFVGEVFRKCLGKLDVSGRPVRVLDLCAAPGGKTTDLAASLRQMYGDDFILVSNEVMKQRAGVLAGNVALWGDPAVVVTSDDPAVFAGYAGYFDVIVADVPCSGEGMFRKDEEAQNQWSEDNVALCAARQKRIVADVWQALADGGIFIYSTCTFNRYENSCNVDWIAEELGAEVLFGEEEFSGYEGILGVRSGFSLVPGLVPGEGQFCAALRKSDGGQVCRPFRQTQQGRGAKGLPDELKRFFKIDVELKQRGDTVIAVPSKIAREVSYIGEKLHLLSSGCAVGMMKGRDFIPDADLALSISLDGNAFASVEVDRATALAFLHRDAVSVGEAPRGYVLLKFEGNPLGFVKNLGNRCNNLHPQGRRIRMDIPAKQ